MDTVDLIKYVMPQFYNKELDRYVVPCEVRKWYSELINPGYSKWFKPWESIMYNGKIVITHCDKHGTNITGADKNRS